MIERLIEFHTQGSARAIVDNLPTENLTPDLRISLLMARISARTTILPCPC